MGTSEYSQVAPLTLVEVARLAAPYRDQPDQLMRVVLAVEKVVPVFSPQVTAVIAREMNLSQTEVYSFISFYERLYTGERGKYIIHMCQSAPCHIRGAKEVLAAIEEFLNIKIGETTEDGLFTLAYAPCIGACDVAPAIMINDKVFGNLTPESVKDVLKSFIREEVSGWRR
ncbi:MAG: NAD(P)H-dependent oxidoreductase subunit E [Oscillospiraceae bacterium]|nr:NAD(P)H-dependent oxidoreductase subunit E [Oscillospiraceae bacterium]